MRAWLGAWPPQDTPTLVLTPSFLDKEREMQIRKEQDVDGGVGGVGTQRQEF